MSEVSNVAVFGYEEVHKKLIEVEKQLSIIALIKEKKDQGFNMQQICDFLNENKIHVDETKRWSLLNG